MDTADWTSFDQRAAMSSNPDDNLSWSIVVNLLVCMQQHVRCAPIIFC